MTALVSGLVWIVRAIIRSSSADLITEIAKITTTLKNLDGRFDSLSKRLVAVDNATQHNARCVAALKARLESHEPVD